MGEQIGDLILQADPRFAALMLPGQSPAGRIQVRRGEGEGIIDRKLLSMIVLEG